MPRESSHTIACTLGTADLATQAERWRRLIAGAAIARHDTADGLRIEFRPDAEAAAELERLVAIENKCCSWATWSVNCGTDPLVLDVASTGAGVVALHSMLMQR